MHPLNFAFSFFYLELLPPFDPSGQPSHFLQYRDIGTPFLTLRYVGKLRIPTNVEAVSFQHILTVS